MYQRTRDIEDALGARLRITVTSHPKDVIISFTRLDVIGQPSVDLSPYGTEILTGFIMAARLSVPASMPDEKAGGPVPVQFRLYCHGQPVILIEQGEARNALCITAPMWDRLYAELCLVTAHVRELMRRTELTVH